jgi:hypothetical protein
MATVSVTCTRTLLEYPACLLPPGSITVLSTTRQNQQIYLFYPQGCSMLSRYFYRLLSCRVRHLRSLHGDTCYVLLRYHYGKTLYGAALRSKVPPTNWHLNSSGSALFVPYRRRGILRLCLLPSLRLRTRTLMLISSTSRTCAHSLLYLLP